MLNIKIIFFAFFFILPFSTLRSNETVIDTDAELTDWSMNSSLDVKSLGIHLQQIAFPIDRIPALIEIPSDFPLVGNVEGSFNEVSHGWSIFATVSEDFQEVIFTALLHYFLDNYPSDPLLKTYYPYGQAQRIFISGNGARYQHPVNMGTHSFTIKELIQNTYLDGNTLRRIWTLVIESPGFNYTRQTHGIKKDVLFYYHIGFQEKSIVPGQW